MSHWPKIYLEALGLFNANGVSQTLVTKGGDLVSREGIVIGGSREKLSGILAKKQELRQLAERIDGLGKQLESARSKQALLESEVRALESELQQRIEQKNDAERALVEAEKSLYRIAEELKHAHRHLDVALLEQERLLGEESDVDDELTKYHQALNDIADRSEQLRNGCLRARPAFDELTQEAEAFDQRVVDVKLELTRLSAKLENTSHTLRRLREFQEDGVRRLEQVTRDIALKKERQATARSSIDTNGQSLTVMYAELENLDQALEQSESEYQDIDDRIRDNDRAISEIQSQRENTLEKFRLLELEQSQYNINATISWPASKKSIRPRSSASRPNSLLRREPPRSTPTSRLKRWKPSSGG